MTGSLLRSALGLLALVFIATAVLAQAGSTGGTIGKQGKSVSGGEEAPPAAGPKTAPSQNRENVSTARNTAATLAGNWNWEASCSSGQWQGGMVLRTASQTDFVGEFNKGHIGSVVGSVTGNRFSFVRDFFGIRQTWSGTLSRSGAKLHMQGPFTDPGRAGCRFSALKE